MKTYARIDNGAVAELFQTPGSIAGMFHPALVWVDVTDITGVAVGWTYNGVTFAAPPAPPVPPSPTTITPLAFIHRFTADEQHAIATAGLANAAVLLWLLKNSAATYVDLTDPLTRIGLDALVAAHLLTADRAAEILAP